MEAAIEQIENEEPRLGKLSDRLCPTHGLHYNPLIAESCARCNEEVEQEKQARLALLIVAVVLFAIMTVIVQVTWLYYMDPSSADAGNLFLQDLWRTVRT